MPSATGPNELHEGWVDILVSAGKEAIKEHPTLVFVVAVSGIVIITQLPKVFKHREAMAKINGENRTVFERERNASRQQQLMLEQTRLIQSMHVGTHNNNSYEQKRTPFITQESGESEND